MRNYFFLSFLSVLFFTACNKPTEPPVPEDETISALARTVSYNNSSDVKVANYDASYKMDAHTSIENDKLALIFLAPPKANNSEGDGIVFHIAANSLQSGQEKTYYYKGMTPNILFSRYSYTFQRADGSVWGSLTDTNMGDYFEGSLTINKYDAATKMISGYYNVQIKNLITDPTVNNSTPPSPDYRVMVTLTGSFENLKVNIP